MLNCGVKATGHLHTVNYVLACYFLGRLICVVVPRIHEDVLKHPFQILFFNDRLPFTSRYIVVPRIHSGLSVVVVVVCWHCGGPIPFKLGGGSGGIESSTECIRTATNISIVGRLMGVTVIWAICCTANNGTTAVR